jgi:hypothetical protein
MDQFDIIGVLTIVLPPLVADALFLVCHQSNPAIAAKASNTKKGRESERGKIKLREGALLKMEASKHLRIAGALQIVQSLTSLPFGVIYVVLYIRDLQEGSHTFEFLMALILALAIFIGLCQLWFGSSLAMQKRWTTRVWGFICCAPGLIMFPMLFSAYTLWVLIMVNQKETCSSSAENDDQGAMKKLNVEERP